MTLTVSDITRLALDVYLKDEESAGVALLCAAEDGESLTSLSDECAKRGIDPVAAIRKQFGKFSI